MKNTYLAVLNIFNKNYYIFYIIYFIWIIIIKFLEFVKIIIGLAIIPMIAEPEGVETSLTGILQIWQKKQALNVVKQK